MVVVVVVFVVGDVIVWLWEKAEMAEVGLSWGRWLRIVRVLVQGVVVVMLVVLDGKVVVKVVVVKVVFEVVVKSRVVK